jgi:hypothetical protein
MIKSRRMRLAGHVACMGGMRNVYKVLVGKSEGKRPFGRPAPSWEIILERILGIYGRKLWIGCSWLRIVDSNGLL